MPSKKLIVGAGRYGSYVYLDNGFIRFTGDYQMHKIILDKLGIYSEFYAARTGHVAYINICIPIIDGNYLKTIEKIRTIEGALGIKFYSIFKIKEKLGKLVLNSI